MPARERHDEYESLILALETVRAEMVRLEDESADLLRSVHPDHRASARNLLHYLALRGYDLRPLQARLSATGLSSLGRAESHCLAAVDAVLITLRCLAGHPEVRHAPNDVLDPATGHRMLNDHTV